MDNGRIFSFDACDASGEPFTPPKLERVLSQIKENIQNEKKPGPGLGSLTALSREPWFGVIHFLNLF